jgi:hypothetical protein
MEEAIMRLRSAQDMIRLLLGNAESKDADKILSEYADSCMK